MEIIGLMKAFLKVQVSFIQNEFELRQKKKTWI